MAVTRWTTLQVADFRAWHEARIIELYSRDPGLLKELRRSREKFLQRLLPKP